MFFYFWPCCSYGGAFLWRAELHKGWNCSGFAYWWSQTINLPAHFCGNWCHSSGIGSVDWKEFLFVLSRFMLTDLFLSCNWKGKWLSKSQAGGDRCYCKRQGIYLGIEFRLPVLSLNLVCLYLFFFLVVWNFFFYVTCFKFSGSWIRCNLLFHLQAELGKPNPSHPDKGRVSMYVDCSPTAEPTFEV